MMISKLEKNADKIAFVLGLALFGFYLYNLTGWFIFDDEGEYLYQVWRMTLGEMPYRDFLTPQLPLFLYAGTAVMKLFGSSIFVMRLYSVVLAFAGGILLYMAGKKHHSALTGLIALLLYLSHADIFKELRIFRNEPIFLFFVVAGIVLATWPTEKRRRYLAGAGVCFGLATMAKLFGLLPAGGIGLWLIWDAIRRKRSIKELIIDGLALGLPVLLVLAVIGGSFYALSPNFLDLVLGHHLAQGEEIPFLEVLQSKAALYLEYVSFYPVFVSLALVSGVYGFIRSDNRQRWAWQLPTALSFLVLSRQFGQRHFMYLLPAFSMLVAWLVADGLRVGWGNGRVRTMSQAVTGLALVAILVPAFQQNVYRSSWVDTETQPILDLIEEHSQPGDYILADDIGLAYYARRPTTYSGAALSHGAITSGQITGELLIEEILQTNVRMVIVDTSLLTGNHIVFLRDYPRFHRFLEQNFQYAGNFRRDFQELDVWFRRSDAPIRQADTVTIQYQDGTQFGETMTLLGYNLPDTVSPGDTLNFTLFWTSDAPAANYWSVFTHLIASEGTLIGQHDKIPYDGVYPPNRWWPGQIIDDDYSIAVPADAASGEYRIQLGMYDWLTGERLPLRANNGGSGPIDQIELEHKVEIVP